MNVIQTDWYCSDFERISDKNIIRRADNTVEKLKSANSLREVTNIKSMTGYPGFYRIRFGDFRIGFSLEADNSVLLLAIGRRSVFYRGFPVNFQ